MFANQSRPEGHSGSVGGANIGPELAQGKLTDANGYQVGGGHYRKGGEQHWDRIWRLYGRGYFVGSATKYIERYHEKGGIEDLKKASHFIEKLIELEIANTRLQQDVSTSSPVRGNQAGGAGSSYVNQS